MGVLYTVWPLDSQMKEWLSSQDIDFPDVPSRWPTKQEIRDVLGALNGFKIKYTENGPCKRWDATIEASYVEDLRTLLHASPDAGSDDTTHIDFEKGEPGLIVAILRDLSVATGPLVVMADAGGPPLVISRQYSFRALMDTWCTVDEESKAWKQLTLGVPGATEGT